MKKSKFTEEQIAFALHQAQTGISVEEVCRRIGVSQAALCAWKGKYAGEDVTELHRLLAALDVEDLLLATTVCLTGLLTLAWVDARAGLLLDVLTITLLWADLLVNLDGAFALQSDAVLGAAVGYLCLWLLYQVFLRA